MKERLPKWDSHWPYWFLLAALLAMSIPHSGYVIYTLFPQDPLEFWLSMAVAAGIEVIILEQTRAIVKRAKEHKPEWWEIAISSIPIALLCALSYYFNTIYAHHFYHTQLLSGAQDVPLFTYLPYIGSSFPLLIVFFTSISTTVGVNITRKDVEKKPVPTLEEYQQQVQMQLVTAQYQRELSRIRGSQVGGIVGEAWRGLWGIHSKTEKRDGEEKKDETSVHLQPENVLMVSQPDPELTLKNDEPITDPGIVTQTRLHVVPEPFDPTKLVNVVDGRPCMRTAQAAKVWEMSEPALKRYLGEHPGYAHIGYVGKTPYNLVDTEAEREAKESAKSKRTAKATSEQAS